MRFGPKVLAALVILTIGVLVSRWVSRGMEHGLQHLQLEPPVRLLRARIARGLVLTLFLIMALQNRRTWNPQCRSAGLPIPRSVCRPNRG